MGIVEGIVGRLSECMVIDSAACSRVRHKLSGCTKCTDICPANAIRITSAGGKVVVDWDRCTACGLCASVCPNRVFTLKLADLGKLMNKVRQQIAEDGECKVSCRDNNDAAAHIRSLSFADRHMLVRFAAMGSGRIILEHGDCGKCSRNCLAVVLAEAEKADRIFELAGMNVRTEIQKYEEKPKRATAADRLKGGGEELTRREFFGFMRTKAKRTIGETLYSMTENEKERQRTILASERKGYEDYIANLLSLGGSQLIQRMRGEGLLVTVDIDSEKCRKCGICARVCPMSVFTLTKETIKGREYTTAVTADPDKCSGCGLCMTSCMYDAVKAYRL